MAQYNVRIVDCLQEQLFNRLADFNCLPIVLA